MSVLKMEIEKSIKLLLIQVYAPTQQADREEIETFYERLQNILHEEREYYNIIMGDFNAKLGENYGQIGINCIGKFCSGNSTNSNGEQMLGFVENNGLKIANTFYKKKASRKWTCRSPDGRTENEIDCFAVNDVRIVKNAEVVRNMMFQSDHRRVRLKLRIPSRCRIREAMKSTINKNKIIPEYNVNLAKQKLKMEMGRIKSQLGNYRNSQKSNR